MLIGSHIDVLLHKHAQGADMQTEERVPVRVLQKGHNFSIWELHVRAVRLLDFYGGAAVVTPEDYFAAQLQRRGASVAR